MSALTSIPISGFLKYWSKTLASEDIMGLPAKGSLVSTTMEAVQAGKLDDINSLKILQDAWEKQKKHGSGDKFANGKNGNDAIKEPVSVIIFLKGFAPIHKDAKAKTGTTHYTLYIPARLDAEGIFTPEQTGNLPWIGREFLSPNETAQSSGPMVGSLDDFDNWLTENPLEAATWPELVAWCDGLWTQVTDDVVPEGFKLLSHVRIAINEKIGNAGRNLRQLYDDLSGRQPPELLRKLCYGGTEHRKVDQDLRDQQLAAPRGTMSTKYGLADSQSDAIAAFTYMKNDEILAVNGPPGTGKTTLLQSIIASEVVTRAIKGEDPAVIVGTSTNNQAVTNINNSLNDVLRRNPAAGKTPWGRRWVPDADTYGLYVPAQAQLEGALTSGYAIADGAYDRWCGFPEREKDQAYLERARSEWLNAFGEAYGQKPETIESGLGTIRRDLSAIGDEICAIQDLVKSARAICQWWSTEAGKKSPEDFIAREDAALKGVVDQSLANLDEAEQDIVSAQVAYDDVILKIKDAEQKAQKDLAQERSRRHKLVNIKGKIADALAPRGFLEVFGLAFPLFRHALIRRQIARFYALMASDPLIARLFEKELLKDDPSICSARIDQLMRNADKKIEQLQVAHKDDTQRRHEEAHRANRAIRQSEDDKIAALHKLNGARARRTERLDLLNAKMKEREHEIAKLRSARDALLRQAFEEFYISSKEGEAIRSQESTDFDRLLDVTLRYKAFQLAMRYWEGRWIIEAQKIQDGDVKTKRGRQGMEARFRRWCMLTPCLVITLDLLPRIFSYWQQDKDDFMLGYIDLLIIDEAGQVGPHKGAAAFALAKKAIVVGDIYQIEPITKVTGGVDCGNAKRCGLDSLWDEGDPVSPHIVSEPRGGTLQGSIMRLAQQATRFVSPNTEKEPGIFLTEHRRCRKEIIAYCNDLVYGNRLIPLSPPREKEPPLPPMAWAHVRGFARKRGGSNENPLEAKAISDWIVENAGIWCAPDCYGRPIEEIVAVVTPFRAQVRLIRDALRKAGESFAGITVGTVHSMQGAEKPIVVFSPTYNADDKAQPHHLFFNRKPNMLNVTVSRAMDSFVVIGDMRLFRDGNDRLPSSVLGKYLFEKEENELLDVGGNVRFTTELLKQAERISAIERHREVLCTGLMNAGSGQSVIIASPWVTMKAVEDDGIIPLVAAAAQRGAKVRIVYDRELSMRHPEREAERAVAELKKAGAVMCPVINMHNKTLIIGNSEITEGSFNWLSAHRMEGDRYRRYDASWRISGQAAIEDIESAKQEFEKLGANLEL